jgi:hypothetical protein
MPCLRRPGLVSLLALAPLAGCVVNGTLDPSGGARFSVTLRLVSVVHFEQVKTRLQSPDVVLRGASMTPKKWATFDLETRDVRKLASAPALAHSIVTLEDAEPGTRRITIVLSSPIRPSEAYHNYIGREAKLSIELPGEVVSSNATTTAARTVSWRWPTEELLPRERTELTATFKAPPASPVPPKADRPG